MKLNLYVEQDAAALARFAGAERPMCDGLIVKLGRPDDVLGATLRGNPLSAEWLWDVEIPARRIVTWSGTLAGNLFDAHPINWLPAGREALDQFIDQMVPQLERHDRRLCLQPHSRHILSDAFSCVKFLDKVEGLPIEIALAPASLLEPSMVAAAEDHIVRAFEMLGERCAMVILHDVARSQDGQSLVAAPLGTGVLPRGAVVKAMRDLMPPNLPVVIGPEKMSEQLAWLGVS